jgi:hypothetical protein
MTRAFDDVNEGKFLKQHLGMLSRRPNFEIQLMVKIIIMCLSPKAKLAFLTMTNIRHFGVASNSC